MATTIRQVETVTTWPGAPGGLSDAAAALDPNALWQRIEAYTAHRYTARAVAWIVEGAGDWTPPLAAATITTTEVWDSGEWVAATIAAGPYGLCLPSDGPYRIEATVGGGTAPAAVAEAYRRLAEYLADTDERAGVSSYSVSMGGAIQESYDRAPQWVARAMQLSGAADLLRSYRRAP